MKLYFFFPLILQKIIWVPTNIILCFFGHLKVFGLENLDDVKKPVIFACNHSGELDPIPLPAALPFFSRFSPMFYASREKSFYDTSGWRQLFYGGALFRAWGAYPVYVGLHDYEKSLKHQTDIMRDRGCLCLFPEGSATPDGTIQPAKGGVAYLAHVTNATIVPVRLRGTFHLTCKDFFLCRSSMSITFGAPLAPLATKDARLSINELKKYANYVMNQVDKL